MLTKAVVDAVEVIDPETGERRFLHATGGLRFTACDPSNPEARHLGRLGIRSGGQVVFETLGELPHGLQAHEMAALDGTGEASPSPTQGLADREAGTGEYAKPEVTDLGRVDAEADGEGEGAASEAETGGGEKPKGRPRPQSRTRREAEPAAQS